MPGRATAPLATAPLATARFGTARFGAARSGTARSATAPLAAALLAAALLAAACPPAALAQQPAAADEDRRTRLFKEGKAAADAGQWDEAARKFRQVVAIRSAPKALIALGVAEEHTGHLVAAQAAFKQAREEAADKALTEDLKTANAALEAIRPRVPKLVFTPPDALSGAALELDGTPATPTSGALLVDPGQHTLTATAPGKGTFRATLTVKEGEQRDVAVTFTTSSGPAPTATSGAPDTGRSLAPPTGAIVLGVAGVVLAGAGAGLYGAGSGQYADSEKLCPGQTCTAEVAGKGNDGRTQMIAGDVLLVTGAAALAGAGIYWAVSATSRKPPTTSLLLTAGPAALTLSGRF
jgi:tetratricopeptide (TPR) repeat protein